MNKLKKRIMNALTVISLICFSTTGFCQDETDSLEWKILTDSFGNAINFYNVVDTQPKFDKMISIYKPNIESFSEVVDSIIKTLIPSRDIDKSHIQFYLLTYGSVYSKKKEYIIANFMLKHATNYGTVLDARDYFVIGTNYYLQGLNDSALVYLKKSLFLDSTYVDTHNNLGWTYLELNNTEDAVHYFNSAYSIDPSDVVNLNNYGYALYLNNDMKAAEQLILDAKNLDPTNSFVYRNLGLIFMKQGKRKLACKNLEKSIELKIVEQYGQEYISELIEYCNK